MPASALSSRSRKQRCHQSHDAKPQSICSENLHYVSHDQETTAKGIRFVNMCRGFCGLKRHVLSHIKKAIHRIMTFSKPTSLDMNISDATQRLHKNGVEFGYLFQLGLEEFFKKGPPHRNKIYLPLDYFDHVSS